MHSQISVIKAIVIIQFPTQDENSNLSQMFCQQISLNSARTAHLTGICLSFKSPSAVPVPFQITSLLVQSHIPLVSPLQWEIVLFSTEQKSFPCGKSQERFLGFLVTSTGLISTPSALLLHVNPFSLLQRVPLQSCTSPTIMQVTVLRQYS